MKFADPFLPQKIRENRIDEIRECVGCNICVSMDAYGVPLRCTQNPTIGEEWQRNWHPEIIGRAPKAENTLIVGAGPAGLEAALTLAKAGHQVMLAEAAEEVGDRARLEGGLPGLQGYRRVIDYRIWNLQQIGNVDIYTSSPLGADELGDFDAYNIIFATGASWRRDGVGRTGFEPVTWENEDAVFTPGDIISGVVPKGPVVIYDDDHFYLASVLAEHLHAKGCDVTYVTPLESVAAWTAYTLEQKNIISRLKALRIPIHVNAGFTGFRNGVFEFEDAYALNGAKSAEAASLVFTGARLPNKELISAFQKSRQRPASLRSGIASCPA